MVIVSASTPDLMTIGRVKNILIVDRDTVFLYLQIGEAVRNQLGLYFEVSNSDEYETTYECVDINKLVTFKPQYCIGTEIQYIFFLKSSVRYS